MRGPRAWLPRTTRGLLLTLVGVVLAPLLLVQAGVYVRWFQLEVAREYESNLEMARAVSLAFGGFVRDVARQEQALGEALVRLQPYEPEQANDLLRGSIREYANLRTFNWATPDGQVIASNRPQDIGLSVADREYFQRIRQGEVHVVSDLLYSKTDGHPVFVIARGIRDDAGVLQGVVAAEVDPDKLGVLALNIRRAGEGITILFDRTGTLVFWLPEMGLKEESRNWVKIDPQLVAALKGEEASGVFTPPFEGHQEVRIASRVPIPELGWVAGAGRPRRTVLAPILHDLEVSGGAVAGVAFLSVLAALLLRHRMTASVQSLRDLAVSLGEGNPSHQVAPTGVAEVDLLAEDFNHMAQRLEERSRLVEQKTTELVRSNRDLEQFAYVASHDLQEPLRMVIGYLQLLERRYKGNLDSNADEFIAFAVEGATRMRNLIADLLAYSRVNTQGKPLVPTDCNAVLRRALADLQPDSESSGAQLTFDPLPTVRGDAVQLQQLFQNLLSNGLKFHREEPPRIHVSAQAQGGEWLFSVRDNGIGLDPQYADQIFVIFKRLHGREEYSGTGIGLAICKRVVERHGGRIWVESKPGQGATFYFTLPQGEENL